MGTRQLRVPLVLGALLFLLTGCGGSTSDVADAVEEAMGKQTVSGNFPQLAEASNISCQPQGEFRGYQVFDCTWTRSDGEEVTGTWLMEGGADYDLARVSEGGGEGGPPLDPEEATERVNTVIEGRSKLGGSTECEEKKEAYPHNYTCLLFRKDGSVLSVDGEPVYTEWRWNEDGTVARESLDLDPYGEYAP